MTTYDVRAQDYYAALAASEAASLPSTFVGTVNVFLCEAPMKGLIARYDLAGESVLSLGAGTAFEEYWLHRAGCRLTLNDLDQPDRKIERYLRTLRRANEGSPDSLQYEIGDAAETVEKYPSGACDVLYVSSFHPDEIRRETIQEEFKKRRSPEEAKNHITWPRDEKPYIDVMMQAIDKVRPGGLVIFQHYRGGVYVDSNPHYLDAVRAHLEENGAVVVEVYSFRKSPPHQLLVAYRGTADQALQFAREKLSDRPAITAFHGRYPDESIKSDVVKVFSIADPNIRAETAFLSPGAPALSAAEMQRMSVHTVRAAHYYAGLENPGADTPDTPVGVHKVLLCKAPMTQLLERYAIRNRRVLSLGAGEGYEEYWLHAAGCALTLNDLDKSGGLQSYVKSLPHTDGPVPDPLVYAYGDASEFLDQIPDQSFDVLYVSSFHPDEIRREEIQEKFTWRESRRWQRIQGITWPDATEPYLSVLMRAILKVCPGGLVIFQHYRGGVDVDANLHYLDAVEKQLSAHGATLLEIYAFRKRPANTLVVSYRGGRADALEFARERLAQRPALSTFHGRYPYERLKADIVKVYDIGRGGIIARDVYPLSHLCIRAGLRVARMALRKMRIAQ